MHPLIKWLGIAAGRRGAAWRGLALSDRVAALYSLLSPPPRSPPPPSHFTLRTPTHGIGTSGKQTRSTLQRSDRVSTEAPCLLPETRHRTAYRTAVEFPERHGTARHNGTARHGTMAASRLGLIRRNRAARGGRRATRWPKPTGRRVVRQADDRSPMPPHASAAKPCTDDPDSL